VDDLVERVRVAVASQPFMATLGVTVAHAAPGEVDLELPFDERLTQQHGFLHAGAVAAVLDSACGYAAWSTAEDEADVLTVEYKINLLEPAVGERVIARGRVVRRGGRLTVCHGEAYADDTLIATSTTTMALRPR
jgi:uncharacterized protein (TIGR00369 family)